MHIGSIQQIDEDDQREQTNDGQFWVVTGGDEKTFFLYWTNQPLYPYGQIYTNLQIHDSCKRHRDDVSSGKRCTKNMVDDTGTRSEKASTQSNKLAAPLSYHKSMVMPLQHDGNLATRYDLHDGTRSTGLGVQCAHVLAVSHFPYTARSDRWGQLLPLHLRKPAS